MAHAQHPPLCPREPRPTHGSVHVVGHGAACGAAERADAQGSEVHPEDMHWQPAVEAEPTDQPARAVGWYAAQPRTRAVQLPAGRVQPAVTPA